MVVKGHRPFPGWFLRVIEGSAHSAYDARLKRLRMDQADLARECEDEAALARQAKLYLEAAWRAHRATKAKR